jgi:uncharacterized protein YdaU (DUF1376 family)
MSQPYMKLWVGDYMGDTRHLTTEQHGAYLLMLMSMWAHGGTLPADAKILARVAGVSPSRWRKIGPDVMAFFAIDEGLITQKRLKIELQKAQEKSQLARASANAKYRKNNDAPPANAERSDSYHSHSHLITESESKETKVVAARSARDELLEVLDAEHADAVIAHRRQKHPLTAYAAKQLARALGKAPNPNDAADVMIAQGWRGFRLSWYQNLDQRGGPQGLSRTQQAIKKHLEEICDEEPTSQDGPGRRALREAHSFNGSGQLHAAAAGPYSDAETAYYAVPWEAQDDPTEAG